MEPKYYAFRRWLDTLIIIWEYVGWFLGNPSWEIHSHGPVDPLFWGFHLPVRWPLGSWAPTGTFVDPTTGVLVEFRRRVGGGWIQWQASKTIGRGKSCGCRPVFFSSCVVFDAFGKHHLFWETWSWSKNDHNERLWCISLMLHFENWSDPRSDQPNLFGWVWMRVNFRRPSFFFYWKVCTSKSLRKITYGSLFPISHSACLAVIPKRISV